ncbi:response regulator transcription factor, partial [Streptomyces beijiangensis]|nr:response regulator transcription factor [Streptomyces beijiangensis]
MRPGVARRVLGFLSRPQQVADPCPELTPRERDVLGLIAAGSPDSAVADRAEAVRGAWVTGGR